MAETLTFIELQDLQGKISHQTEKLEMAIGSLGNELVLLNHEVKKLNILITEANKKNDKLQGKLFWLTLAGTLFALISVIEAVDIILKRVLGI